jgi:hypothetical protein
MWFGLHDIQNTAPHFHLCEGILLRSHSEYLTGEKFSLEGYLPMKYRKQQAPQSANPNQNY